MQPFCRKHADAKIVNSGASNVVRQWHGTTLLQGAVAVLTLTAACNFNRSGLPRTLLENDAPTTADLALPREQLPALDGTTTDRGDAADLAAVVEAPVGDHAPTDTAQACRGLTCALGCNTAAGRCNRLAPSNFTASFFDQVTAAVAGSGGNVQFNTDTGEVLRGTTVLRPAGNPNAVAQGIYYGVVVQGGGFPELGVFGVKSLDIPAGATASIVGVRAFALYSTTAIHVAGTLQALPNTHQPGAGGFSGGAQDGLTAAACAGGEGKGGGQAGSSSSQIEAGGGGGGRGAAGGNGANAVSGPNVALGGAGGLAVADNGLSPLRGGCGGGAGGGPDTAARLSHGGAGGGGGGAIQLAANEKIDVLGSVYVPGAGGDGGHWGAGGGGGGSGGAVLLQAPTVRVTGGIYANGGGGGTGAGSTAVADAPDGERGRASLLAAKGGAASSPYGGRGGAGGVASSPSGSDGVQNGNSGGGGGGVGRFHCAARLLSTASAKLPPTPTQSATLSTF